ncbi:MAG: transposase [Candidatus Electronema sp. VV]
MLEEFEGAAPADKGFIDERRQSLLLERHGILVVTPPRKNMKTTLPESLLKFCRRIRKRIETVGSHLTERFKIDHIRVHDECLTVQDHLQYYRHYMLYLHQRHFQMEQEKKSHKENLCLNMAMETKILSTGIGVTQLIKIS